MLCLHAVGETGQAVWILLYVMPPVQVIEELKGRIPGLPRLIFWFVFARIYEEAKAMQNKF